MTTKRGHRQSGEHWTSIGTVLTAALEKRLRDRVERNIIFMGFSERIDISLN